ncbi:MAG: hypothetical protein IJF54_06785 [Clostridia bacterium]|nr:hypothetical protein [Clostridia bacterium]
MNYRDCVCQCSNARILDCCDNDRSVRDTDNCGCEQTRCGCRQQRQQRQCGCGCNNAYDRDADERYNDCDDDREYRVPRSCR